LQIATNPKENHISIVPPPIKANRKIRKIVLTISPHKINQNKHLPSAPTQPSADTPLIPTLDRVSFPHFVDHDAFPLEPPGFGQTDDVDTNLLDEMASSNPLDSVPGSGPQLAIYRGKELIRSSVEAGSSSTPGQVKAEKALVWSRGIGTEVSPLQTRSSRKHKELLKSAHSGSDLPIQEEKALRALKAIARSKK
jgi:hypothetical protein